MPRAVHFRVLAIFETAFLRLLTKTALLERVVATSDLDDLVGKTVAQCFLENSSVMIAADMLVCDEIERVQYSLQDKRAREEKEAMHP